MENPTRPRFLFVDDSEPTLTLTGQNILSRSMAFANGLRDCSDYGSRVLLPYPPGLDFVIGFLGCMAAGRIPVPANYPKPHRPTSRYHGIAGDCQCTLAVTPESTLETLSGLKQSGLIWSAAEEIEARGREAVGRTESLHRLDSQRNLQLQVDAALDEFETQWKRRPATGLGGNGNGRARSDVLFLQYTSGSTCDPKGVMISPANLLSNLATICHGFGLERLPPNRRAVCSWLPAYHDMGLVGVILSTLMHDGQAILMSPASFLRRPALWLESIDQYQASITVAPCFGYQWATARVSPSEANRINLQHLKLAACGAESISPHVLDRFALRFEETGFCKDSFYPCYGLAEATLMVSGDHWADDAPVRQNGITSSLSLHFQRTALRRYTAAKANPADDSIELVHCGMPGIDTEIALISQETGRRAAEGEIGEILVHSNSTAVGYWNAPDATRETFEFCFPQESKPYLRTGDLGFLLNGRLFVTGRRKELIIIAGQNFYPHDIEQAVASAHPLLAGLPAAAFAVSGDATDQLVLVQEVPRGIDQPTCDEIMRKMRLAVASIHDLAAHTVQLVRPASIAKTSSGKVRRLQTCEDHLAGRLKIIASWQLKSIDDENLFRDIQPLIGPGREARLRIRIEQTLVKWVALQTGEDSNRIDADQSFAEMGIDSLLSVQLAQDFEQWLGCRISPVAAWSYPTPSKMADFLLDQICLEGAAESASQTGMDRHASTENALEAVSTEELAAILDQLEKLDEAETQALLQRDRSS